MPLRKLTRREYDRLGIVFGRWYQAEKWSFCDELRMLDGTTTIGVGPRGGILTAGRNGQLKAQQFRSARRELRDRGFLLITNQHTRKVHVRKEC